MPQFFHHLGTSAYRRRGLVLAGWLVVLVLTIGGSLAWSQTATAGLDVPGTEAQEAIDTLNRQFPEASAEAAVARVVVAADEGESLRDAANATLLNELAGKLGALPQVAWASPADDSASPGGARIALIQVTYAVGGHEITSTARESLAEVLDEARDAGLRVEVGGDAMDEDVEMGNAEIIGVAVAALVLLMTFGSLVAAGLPLLTAVIGVVIGSSGIALSTAVIEMPASASSLALMLGLAVGIDYALFIISRYRTELLSGRSCEEAAGRAVATAGSAVAFAGLTVVIALAGLVVVGIPFLTAMGLASAGVVALAVLVALTLVPALLGFTGRRVLGRRAGAPRSGPAVHRPTLGRRWVEALLRRPRTVVTAGVALLAVAAVPALDLRLGLPDDGMAAPGSSPRLAYDLLADAFGPGFNGPLTVVVEGGEAASARAAVNELEGVAAVSPARASATGEVSVFSVIPTTGPNDPATSDLVDAIRTTTTDLRTGQVSVSGRTAVNIDASTVIRDSLPRYLALIVGMAFLLLLLVFRSVLVPLKATLGFLLTIGATFGVMVAVFQWGWLNDVLGVPATGPIVSVMPIFIIGIAFGLAMDYEVFLVTRMREAWVAGARPEIAVIDGFAASARVVTAAAAIMVSIFTGFMLAPDLTLKMPGLGLATAILVDAFVVRMTIVPAALALLGRVAWWLPAWLDRALPDVNVEGRGIESTEVHEPAISVLLPTR